MIFFFTGHTLDSENLLLFQKHRSYEFRDDFDSSAIKIGTYVEQKVIFMEALQVFEAFDA